MALMSEVITLIHSIVYSAYLLFLSGWLEDAALFAAIDNSINAVSWSEWPEPLKDRHPGALEDIYENQKDYVRSSNYSYCNVIIFYKNTGIFIYCTCYADRDFYGTTVLI